MIDLVIVGLLSWTGIIGWRRGGLRALIDSASVGSAIAMVLFSLPLIKDLIDETWALQFRIWLREQVRTIPTGFGLGSSSSVSDNLYHTVIVGAAAITVWAGIQMILQVFQTVWKEPSGSRLSRILGMLIGTGLGGVLSIYMVQWLGLLSWLKGFEFLDTSLGNSFLIWVIMNYVVM